MKTVGHIPSTNNRKRLSLQLVSLAGGLALATIALLGSSEVLSDRNTEPPSPRAQTFLPGPVMPEPDFGAVTADYSAFGQSVGVSRTIGLVMPEPDFGSVAADYLAFKQSVTAIPGSTDKASGPSSRSTLRHGTRVSFGHRGGLLGV